MAYWGGGGVGGWSGGMQGRGFRGGRGVDGWDYDELGAVYDPTLMRRLVPFLGPFKWRMVIAVISMLVYSIASYSQPFIMGTAVKSIVGKLRSPDPAVVAQVDGDVLRFRVARDAR